LEVVICVTVFKPKIHRSLPVVTAQTNRTSALQSDG